MNAGDAARPGGELERLRAAVIEARTLFVEIVSARDLERARGRARLGRAWMDRVLDAGRGAGSAVPERVRNQAEVTEQVLRRWDEVGLPYAAADEASLHDGRRRPPPTVPRGRDGAG